MASYTVREPGKPGAHRVFNWPLEMFEELATNCILHKEYSRKQYIGIYVYRDHLSFINHNRPLPPVTIEDLNEKTVFDDRHYLNDELKEMFQSRFDPVLRFRNPSRKESNDTQQISKTCFRAG